MLDGDRNTEHLLVLLGDELIPADDALFSEDDDTSVSANAPNSVLVEFQSVEDDSVVLALITLTVESDSPVNVQLETKNPDGTVKDIYVSH